MHGRLVIDNDRATIDRLWSPFAAAQAAVLGLDTGHRKPKFVKDFLAEGGSVAAAIRAYADAVRNGTFPGPEHSYE